MKITDYIKSLFGSKNHVLRQTPNGYLPDWEVCRHRFGETIYLNAVELITDIFSSLTWSSPNPTPKYRAWVDWVNRNGQRVLVQMQRGRGFAVIGYSQTQMGDEMFYSFYELSDDKWHVRREGDKEIVECYDADQLFYVLREPTYEATGKSSHEWCEPFIKMLDAVLNGATTTAERLGAYVVMSPKSDNFGGMLEDTEKDELEKMLQNEYGMLSRQKQIMLLQRPMDAQVVSLAQVDARMKDKANTAILAIADRLKVPANQLAIIDGGQSKAFANGTEYREGDIAKYRTFRRLINATFYDMATELGLRVDYTIEDEPRTVQNQSIENGGGYDAKPNITELNTDLLGVLTTNEKRNALGYGDNAGDDDAVLAQTLGVGGTQSLVAIAQSADLTNKEKQGYLQVLFGLTKQQAEMLAPTIETV